ncbi:MAG: flagellar motor protein MotB [Elusimicrobia bacterium]|nr:flagellar motor protein MotB [Elusimicrobiota bacterium]
MAFDLEGDFSDKKDSIDSDIIKAIEGDSEKPAGTTTETFGEKDRGTKRHFIEESTWVIPYGNLMTILMIFFMILYAFSILYGGGAQYEKAMAAIQKAMGGSAEQLKKIETFEKEVEIGSKMEDFIKEKKLSDYAKVETNAQRIKISLANPILFDSGKAELKDAVKPALKEIAQLIKTMENHIVVEGHTDNIPFRGKEYRSNFELSAARAFSVIDYFINKTNIHPERFSAFGYGEFRPIAPNKTEEGRAKNRRIEINILRKI